MRRTLTKYDLVIGIDPDIDKSGCALLDVAKKEFVLAEGKTLTELMEFFEKLMYQKMTEGKRILVAVEAGWKNKSNWHLQSCRYSRNQIAKAASIGSNAGENWQRGKDILEIAREFFKLDTKDPKPLVKCWNGRDRKITHDELASFTNLTKRNSQDVRDAALLAWVMADLPIILKKKS